MATKFIMPESFVKAVVVAVDSLGGLVSYQGQQIPFYNNAGRKIVPGEEHPEFVNELMPLPPIGKELVIILGPHGRRLSIVAWGSFREYADARDTIKTRRDFTRDQQIMATATPAVRKVNVPRRTPSIRYVAPSSSRSAAAIAA